MAIILLLLLLSLTEAKANPIGEIIQLTGPAQVDKKAGSSVDVSLGSKVESLDTIRTARSRANIKFKDDTQVAITENSKLVIDEYIYDPNRGAGKMSMKIALGTVRYASGAIAKNNNENINIQTPVATIGVRGTSFSMTVDEIGQSLVILLPNRDGTVGEIKVESDAGQVILNKAFQSTYVASSEGKPAQPTILNLTESQINNLLIISKPEKSRDDDHDSKNDPLRIDLLEFRELDTTDLDKDNLKFNDLDVNLLDIDLLQNVLSDYDASSVGKVAGLNQSTQIYTIFNETKIKLIRNVLNEVQMNIEKEKNYSISITQGDMTVSFGINDADSPYVNKIRIIQK
jgi:hypothetical protein